MFSDEESQKVKPQQYAPLSFDLRRTQGHNQLSYLYNKYLIKCRNINANSVNILQ